MMSLRDRSRSPSQYPLVLETRCKKLLLSVLAQLRYHPCLLLANIQLACRPYDARSSRGEEGDVDNAKFQCVVADNDVLADMYGFFQAMIVLSATEALIASALKLITKTKGSSGVFHPFIFIVVLLYFLF